MGNLSGQSCYLCGSVDRREDNGREWRDWITPQLQEYGIIVRNPLKENTFNSAEDAENMKFRKDLKKNGRYKEFSRIMKAIRNKDLRLTDKVDFCICHIDGKGFGTIEELVTINRSKKPCLVVIEDGKPNAPDWLFGMIPHKHIFSSFDELKVYLSWVDVTAEKELYKKRSERRWVFWAM